MGYCLGLSFNGFPRYGQYSFVIAQSNLKLGDDFPKRKSYIYSTKLHKLNFIEYFKFEQIYLQ